jgi:hypothetical protein
VSECLPHALVTRAGEGVSVCLIAEFYLNAELYHKGSDTAAGNLRLESVCWSFGRGSVGSGANGHTTVACPRVRPQVYGVGSNGIAPIVLSVYVATS